MTDLATDADTRNLAGHPASWQRFDLEVSAQAADGSFELLAAAPVELYALQSPENSIDAAALLRERVIADPPYWALVWTGARAIAAVADDLGLSAGTRVLDLGCGLGLSGLAAARCGAAVTFGDYVEGPLLFVRTTLERTPYAACEVRRVDFTSTEDAGGPFDVILAADIVYDPAHYDPLADFLERNIADGGLIALTESLRADARVFLAGMLDRGFRDVKSALWVMEEGRRERTWLHRLSRA